MKTILASLAILSAFALPALAFEPAESFKAVCASPAVKSEKLAAACQSGNMPAVIKAGDRFKAVGIGAELNALAANLAFFQSGTPAK